MIEKLNLGNEGYVFNSESELQSFLNNHNIDTSIWGKGSTKTVEHLFEEIRKNEAVLSIDDGNVVRTIWPLKINVLYKNSDGIEYVLKEQHQTFLDNSGRMRDRELTYAVNEKLQKGEDSNKGVIRALQEELGINGLPKSIEPEPVFIDEKPSGSYPGIFSKTTVYPFEVYLNDEQFNPSGYVEKQKDKMTCFTWTRKDF